MKSNELILKELDKLKRSKKWLAEEINISRSTLQYKLDNNTVSGDELILIGKILNIDLNKAKEDI